MSTSLAVPSTAPAVVTETTATGAGAVLTGTGDVAVGERTTRVLVASRHPALRFGLARLLGAAADIDVVAAAADVDRAAALHGEHLPQVCLVDLDLGAGAAGRPDGVELTRRLLAADPTVRVVLLTTMVDRERLLEAFDAGATGCLLADTEPHRLLDGVRAAARGEAPLAPQVAGALLEERRRRTRVGGAMSARDGEILELLGRGLPNTLIARALGISEKTVKGHLTHIFRGIGVTDRTQAALWVQRTGFAARA